MIGYDEVNSFEPTYKELKLSNRAIFLCVLFGFEPTYKELKLWRDIPQIQQRYGFEPTYKELKQLDWGKEPTPANTVLSLPIRN